MAATERPQPSIQETPEQIDSEVKTVFNVLSKLKTLDTTVKRQDYVSETTIHLETDDDIVILRKDPETNESTINKSAYLKLHRSLSPNRNSTIEKIKEKYEKTDEETEKQPETIESLKNKYSPAGLGYNNSNNNKPQIAPKPRLSRSQIISPSKRNQAKARLSLNIEKNKHKDVNSNHLRKSEENLLNEVEFVTIIPRSDSEESVSKFQKELSAFTMDKKKRANSFRKIFSVFSNKDKKIKKDDKKKPQGETYTDNMQNESNSFSRQAPYRHTTGGEINVNKIQRSDTVPKQYNEEQLEKDYAQMHINQFNKYKQNFENTTKPEPVMKINQDSCYTPMDKPLIYKSNEANGTYMNMPNIRKYIDTSSSASTLESDRSNIYQNDTPTAKPREEEVELRSYPANSFRPSRITDNRRDTPPRLLETKQDVRLVNPKALIPINSERALPNPYQNGNRGGESPVSSLSRSNNKPLHHSSPISEVDNRRPYLEETYGTVIDSLENRQKLLNKQLRSPSVEPTKLRLPPNREIVPLSPRIRSPIPPDDVSTEKLIATELLKPRRSPTPTKRTLKEDHHPSHQRLEINIDYPENLKNHPSKDSLLNSSDNIASKPPMSVKPLMRRPPNNNDSSRTSQTSKGSSNESVLLRNRSSPDRVITNAQVHINSPPNRTPTPNNSNSNQNLSLSPIKPTSLNIRPSTPSGMQLSESPKTTPQKEDMRKSVEAYYWKEIKKLKDQENYELYLLQMQYGNLLPYGYAEDPISVRRSRSMSPSANRNGRRSLSLPRETRPPTNIIPEKYYPNPIPENRAVTNQVQQPRSVQQLQFQYFQRNAPERSTIDGSPRTTNSLYRPIFKRGSLSTPPRQLLMDDTLKRKVSFSNNPQEQNVQAWPTKNGFTQSPPQRRMDKLQSQGDDEVFFPNTPINTNTKGGANDSLYPRYTNSKTRTDLPNEEMYYTRQNPDNEPMYVLRAKQNSLYLHARRQPNQPDEVLYGQPIDAVRAPPPLSRHGSIQIQEELYAPRRMASFQTNSLARPSVPSTPVLINQEAQYVPRRPPSQQGVQHLRREIIVNDEIFGQFGGYSGPHNNVRVVAPPQNVYASRQSIAEYNSRVRDEYYNRQPQKQVSVNNKVCDMFGQIHDVDSPTTPVQQSGVIMGQLQQNPGSPAIVRNSYTQLAGRDSFVRNSRLTASANDMYRRVQQPSGNETLYGRIEQQNGAPTRPLPPVPQKRGNVVRNNMVSDTESGSDVSEIQRILNNNPKAKKRGIFGK